MQLITQRLLTVVPTIGGVCVLTFILFSVLPGDLAEQLLGADATQEQIDEFRRELGLDQSFLDGGASWVKGLLHADLGRSLASGLPVTQLLAERLPVSLQLAAYALLIALTFALPAATVGARWPGGRVDRLCTALSMVSLSVPSYIVATTLVLMFAVSVPLFPAIGFARLSDGLLKHWNSLTLPSIALASPLFGLYTQFLRGALMEQVHSEGYMITAMAKGLGPWQVLIKHALRNSLLGLLTIVGLHVGTLISGAVVIEQIFGLPGIGQLLVQAVRVRDVAVVQGVVVVLATITILVNMVVDLLYAMLDPRVRFRGD